MKNYEAMALEVKQIAKVLMSVYNPNKFNLYMDYFMCFYKFHFDKLKNDVRVWKLSHVSKAQKN